MHSNSLVNKQTPNTSLLDIDWDFYLKLPLCTSHQFSSLLYGCDPEWLTEKSKWQRNKNPIIIQDEIKRLDVCIRSYIPQPVKLIANIDKLAKRLNSEEVIASLDSYTWNTGRKSLPQHTPDNSYRIRRYFEPVALIKWAIKNNYPVPDAMRDFLKNLELQSITATKPNKAQQRADHIKEWVARKSYEGGLKDQELLDQLRLDHRKLWSCELSTFQKWIQTKEAETVKHLIPNPRRELSGR